MAEDDVAEAQRRRDERQRNTGHNGLAHHAIELDATVVPLEVRRWHVLCNAVCLWAAIHGVVHQPGHVAHRDVDGDVVRAIYCQLLKVGDGAVDDDAVKK